MMKDERLKKIIETIYYTENVTIQSLAEKFNVSTMTIRRDLKMLEKQNYIKRTRCGAVPNMIKYRENSYEKRTIAMKKEKELIAKKTLQYIKNGETIILDSGTTAHEVAKLLAMQNNLKITLIINNFYIYDLLKMNKLIKIIFAGGTIENNYESHTSGYINNQFYKDFNVDKAFITVLSVDFIDGIFHSNLDIVMSKKGMIDAAREIYLIVDHTKFNSQAMYRISPIDKVDYIITDTKFDSNKYLIPSHIKVY